MTSSKRYGSRVQLNHLKNKDISYYITYKDGDKTVYKKVGKKSEGVTEAKCMNLRSQILSEQRHGIDLSQKSAKHLTLDMLADLYFKSSAAHNKSNHQNRLMYKKHIKDSFGDITISKLEDSLISEFQALKVSDGLSKSSVNIMVKLITRIVGFGIKRGIINHSPFKNIKLFKVENTRQRYLSKKEIAQLKEMVKGDILLNLFVRISLGTGARANSVLAIQKKHIDVENKSITLRDFKRNGMTYIGYLDDISFQNIVSYTRFFKADDYVVSLDRKLLKYSKLYKNIKDYLDVFNDGLSSYDRANRVVIHTLRHTFASHLAIAGTPLQEIQKLMNHKDIKQTLKYAKLMPNSGRKYVENLYKDRG